MVRLRGPGYRLRNADSGLWLGTARPSLPGVIKCQLDRRVSEVELEAICKLKSQGAFALGAAGGSHRWSISTC